MMLYFQSASFVLLKKFKIPIEMFIFISILIAFSYLSGGLIVIRMSQRFSNKNLIAIGFNLTIISSILFLLLNYLFEDNLFFYIIPILLFFIGARVVIPSALSGAMSHTDSSGAASSLMGIIQMLFSSILSFFYVYASKDNILIFGLLLMSISFVGRYCIYLLKNEEDTRC
jgi:hypothetical protein